MNIDYLLICLIASITQTNFKTTNLDNEEQCVTLLVGNLINVA
jgi:hypothetical protein